jgi:hypothetical protein
MAGIDSFISQLDRITTFELDRIVMMRIAKILRFARYFLGLFLCIFVFVLQ